MAGYETSAAARIAPSTLAARMVRLRRFAADLGGDGPEAVSRAGFEVWAGSLPCSISTTGQYVEACRAFYRWAVRSGVVGESPVPAPAVRRRYALDARWDDAVGAFARAQRARGIEDATVRRRAQHVRRFAATVGLPPWHVSTEDYLIWMRENGAGTTAASLRDSLRAFYRWGHGAGRIDSDPTAEPMRRGVALGVPESWEQPLHSWRRWMLANGTAATTVRARVEQLGTFAREHASCAPWDVSTEDIYDWMAGKRWARETRRGRRATLRAFYQWAHELGHVVVDPTEVLPRVRAGEPAARPATGDEYAAALRASRDERWTLALRMACELGMRRAEVAQAHAADLVRGIDGWWLTVRGKGGKVRRLPVPSELASRIAEHRGYLFPSAAGHLTPRYLGKRVGELLPPGVSMHSLRHAFATRAYNVNRDVFAVQRLLGHASAATTQRYVQVSDQRMRELVEAARWSSLRAE